MKKIITILYCIIVFSCTGNSQESKIMIKGNWYTNYFIKGAEDDSNYTEVFFANDTIYSCNEWSGFQISRRIVFSNDSIFFSPKKDLNFIGVIKLISEEKFLLEVEGEGEFLYNKINQGSTIEDYQMKKVTQREYLDSYYKRKIKLKNKKN